jgi:hypothetical protein
MIRGREKAPSLSNLCSTCRSCQMPCLSVQTPYFVLFIIDTNDAARSGAGRDGPPFRLVLMVCQTNYGGAKALAGLDPRALMDK